MAILPMRLRDEKYRNAFAASATSNMCSGSTARILPARYSAMTSASSAAQSAWWRSSGVLYR
jgi:hypothetical protein